MCNKSWKFFGSFDFSSLALAGSVFTFCSCSPLSLVSCDTWNSTRARVEANGWSLSVSSSEFCWSSTADDWCSTLSRKSILRSLMCLIDRQNFDFVAVLNCRIIKFSFLCFSEWLDKVENVWKIRNCPCKLNLNGFKSKNFSHFPFHCAITRIYFSRNHDSLGCLMCGIIHRIHRIDDGHTMNLARGESR